MSLSIRNELEARVGESAPETLSRVLSRVDSTGLVELAPLVDHAPEGHSSLVEMIPTEVHPLVREAIATRRTELDEKRAIHNASELQKLLKEIPGLPEELAQEMLTLSQSHEKLSSAFRAGNLLPVLDPKYRTEAQIGRVGDRVWDSKLTIEVYKVAFYSDNTLAALQIIDENPAVTPLQAAQTVVANAEAETRKQFAEQQQALQASRQAEADHAAAARLQAQSSL